MIEIDLTNNTLAGIFPLGMKDHSLQANALDADKNDEVANIVPQPYFGLYMPDSIAAFSVGGQDYIVTANEGDGRDPDDFGDFPGNGLGDEIDVKDLDLDGDGDVDQILIGGARSFSIWNPDTGALVFDSGSDFETITAQALPENFNASNDDNTIDDRSDNKGPEPEALAVAELDGRIFAFIGLERVSGVMIYDITEPNAPVFIDYINDRDFSLAPEQQSDLGPEGIIFVPANDSPNGEPLLLIASEVSGSLTSYAIRPAPPAPLRDAANLVENWYSLDWFGSFAITGSFAQQWVFSKDFGWSFISTESNSEGIWFYSQSLQTWLFSNENSDRIFYNWGAGAWMVASSNPDGNGVWLYNFDTTEWTFFAH
jgi:hypothetical protein